ncbi:hypothetical protein [Gordonia sp. DT101]|uniref:VG15 protein n=1 Tax=Gordonia sp. DT101 TaxID=3416545 RepID=UPI003CEF61E0
MTADLRPVLTLISGSATRTIRNGLGDRPSLSLIPFVAEVTAGHAEAARAAAVTAYTADRLDANAPGRYSAEMPEPKWLDIEGLWIWAEGTATSKAAFMSLLLGGVEKRIAGAARLTIAHNASRDSAARGWQRVARGKACSFCIMLASRGAVYTRATADFASHDHCHCVAVAAWKNRPTPVKPYTPSSKTITDADHSRVREWISANEARLGIVPHPAAIETAAA